MTTGIKTKHFLTLFLVSSIVVAGMYFFMQWSFHRGFFNYVNLQELNNMDRLAEHLVDYYREAGSWEGMAGNPRLWHQMLRKAGPQGGPPPFLQGVPPRARQGAPPPGALPPPEGGAPQDPLRIGPRLGLFAADRQTLIFGRAVKNLDRVSMRPLELNGRVIGYLGLDQPAQLASSTDLIYVKKQKRLFGIIALIMILVSMALGIPLVNHLLVPIKAMTKGAEALASGDFSARIPVLTRDELGKLTQVFNLLATTLERSEASRREWMANISHELRTPLAILCGGIEALRDGVRKPDDKTLAALYGETQRLNRLVGDLYELTMSDIGALSYRKHPIDPVLSLEQAVELFTPRMAAAGITLTAQLPPEGALEINVDPQRFQQLLTNLLENSLRYTDPEGRVELRLEGTADELRLSLQDSAPGVPPKQLPKLFERLYRVDHSRSRTRGGTGLGLAICQNIVEAHQGRITALPSPLGGLRIEINLPRI